MASWFGTSNTPNVFLAGDPNLQDILVYKETVKRSSNNPFTVKFTMREEGQKISAIAVLPISDDRPAPEVEVIDGGINFRNVTMRLTPVQGGCGCHISISGS